MLLGLFRTGGSPEATWARQPARAEWRRWVLASELPITLGTEVWHPLHCGCHSAALSVIRDVCPLSLSDTSLLLLHAVGIVPLPPSPCWVWAPNQMHSRRTAALGPASALPGQCPEAGRGDCRDKRSPPTPSFFPSFFFFFFIWGEWGSS